MRRASLLVAAAGLVAGLVPASGRAATTVTVYMNAFRFCNLPACATSENTTIRKGDTVQWMFIDGACVALHAIGCYHTTTRTGTLEAFDSPQMPGPPVTFGGTSPKLMFSHTFNTVNTAGYDYFCSFHVNTFAMKAKIIVMP